MFSLFKDVCSEGNSKEKYIILIVVLLFCVQPTLNQLVNLPYFLRTCNWMSFTLFKT